MTWPEYAALARHLAHVTRPETPEPVDAGPLDGRLVAQRERLTQLGRAIGQHVSSQPAPPATNGDPAEAVRLAERSADAADAAATETEELARRAPLFPGISPVARNLFVYSACALVAVVFQFVLLSLGDAGRVDTISVFAWMCAGLPAAAFFAGYLIISIWGKPRLPAGDPPRNPRLGFAVCFLAMPIVYCGLKVASAVI